jgi:hypothetical protein
MRIWMSWLGGLVLALAAHGQDFTRTMTADEQAAAGLGKLTPGELAQLRAAVERYKAGEVGAAQERVAATEEKAKVAEQKAAAAEAKVREVEAKVAASAPAKKGPSWLSALITLEKTAQAPDASEALESRLKSDFTGWRKGTVFELENGQRWQQAGGDDYVTPSMPPPVVRIKPGVLGSYWMQIEGVRTRVKVKPLKLE